MKQYILKTRVMVPDNVSEYDVEKVIDGAMTKGLKNEIGIDDWIVGTTIVVETNEGFPDLTNM